MSSDDAIDGVTEGWDPLDFEKARQLDDQMDRDQAMELAFNKLVNRVGTRPEEDVGPLEAAYRTITTIDDIAERVTRLENEMDRVDRNAETARTVAERRAQPGDKVPKKELARLKSRNELLRKLAVDRSSTKGTSILASDVQEMAKPETKLNYQTVYDAWDDLQTNWDAFSRTANEEGTKVLHVEKDALEPGLVKTVETALERDDLSKRLLSRAEREGV